LGESRFHSLWTARFCIFNGRASSYRFSMC
jgi:hypothetical protein